MRGREQQALSCAAKGLQSGVMVYNTAAHLFHESCSRAKARHHAALGIAKPQTKLQLQLHQSNSPELCSCTTAFTAADMKQIKQACAGAAWHHVFDMRSHRLHRLLENP
jgi:hypothetical protein